METDITFAEVAQRYIREMTPGWRDLRVVTIWTSPRKGVAFLMVGAKSVAEVETEDVLSFLRLVWQTTRETVDRLPGRIERILDYACTHGWRDGENPARWRGHLANILPKPSAITKVRHQAAVPRKDIAGVMAGPAGSDGTAAKVARFAGLTAECSGEVRHAT